MSRQTLAALPFSEILASAPLVTLGALPPEATYATVRYCIEADDMPSIRVALDVFRDVPARLVEVPVTVLRSFMMSIPEIADDFKSFDEYHAWYVKNNRTPRYGAENRWPCIASKLPDEAVQDGSHRMHSYIRAGHAAIPILDYDAKAWWKAHEHWKLLKPEPAPPMRIKKSRP